MVKESPALQELGPKKYRERMEKANKDYDKYKAGKKNPKTGEFYHHIDLNDPRIPKHYGNSSLSETLGYTPCEHCGEKISVGAISSGKCCLYCGEYMFFSTELKDKLRQERADGEA